MLTEAYVGLGSNLGSRERRLTCALEAIARLGEGVQASAFYETEPWGFTTQPSFLNAACRLWTRLDPFRLLWKLREIERAVGPGKAFPNGPRPLDLDILLYGRLVLDVPGLSIPHPRLTEREFVLVPLLELAPGLVHPVTGRPLSSYLRSEKTE